MVWKDKVLCTMDKLSVQGCNLKRPGCASPIFNRILGVFIQMSGGSYAPPHCYVAPPLFLTAAKYIHSCDVSVVCDIIYTIYASRIGWIIDNMCNQVVHIQVKYFVWRMNCLCVKHIVMRTEKKRVIINGIIIRRTSDIEIESTKLVNLNSTSSVFSFFNITFTYSIVSIIQLI
jgi:hypothetical protein